MATSADWQEVHEKVIRFNADYFDVPVDDAKLYQWFKQHLSIGVIYLSDHGFLSGLVISDPVRDWNAFIETGWYDTGRTGARLLRKAINFSRNEGLDEIRVCTMYSTDPTVVALLAKLGFQLDRERSHSMKL